MEITFGMDLYHQTKPLKEAMSFFGDLFPCLKELGATSFESKWAYQNKFDFFNESCYN